MNDSDTSGFDITFSVCEYVEAWAKHQLYLFPLYRND
jgi:hypothetical protein